MSLHLSIPHTVVCSAASCNKEYSCECEDMVEFMNSCVDKQEHWCSPECYEVWKKEKVNCCDICDTELERIGHGVYGCVPCQTVSVDKNIKDPDMDYQRFLDEEGHNE